MSQGIVQSNWYQFWDNESTDNKFGVLAQNGTGGWTPKPAYNEMQLLTHSLTGETFTSRLSSNSKDWLLVFTSPSGQQTLAAWTTRSSPYTLPCRAGGPFHLTSTPFYVNPTLLPGDANLDGTVNVQDLAILAANYRKHVSGGWTQADFNHDGVVDVMTWPFWRPTTGIVLASDVVPAYDGLDAAAIQLLSLAGVTAVPEPGALIMLAVALIGALACTWRTQK